MHWSSNASRGFLLVAAAAGLWVLGNVGVQADDPPSGQGTSGDISELTEVVERSMGKNAPGDADRNGAGGKAGSGEQTDDMKDGAGKAAEHVTEKTGKAVSTAPAGAARADLGAVSGVTTTAAAPSEAGLPEDVVIEAPEVVPGVPSVGVVPLSLPALPVTPEVPTL